MKLKIVLITALLFTLKTFAGNEPLPPSPNDPLPQSPRELAVILLMDDSRSMSPNHNKKMAKKLTEALNYLEKKTEFFIAVGNVDKEDNLLRTFTANGATSHVANTELISIKQIVAKTVRPELYQWAITWGTKEEPAMPYIGSGRELHLSSAAVVLDRLTTEEIDTLTDKKKVAIIPVTDEDAKDSDVKASIQMIRAMAPTADIAIFPIMIEPHTQAGRDCYEKERFHWHYIFTDSEKRNNRAEYGENLLKAATMTKGSTADFCSSSYMPLIDDILNWADL